MSYRDGSEFPGYAAVRAALARPAFEYNGVRKIVQSIGYSLPSLPAINLEDIFYTKAKEKALFRMYYNELEAERIKALLKKREKQGFSAISMSMRGSSKRADSMGHCMEAIVFSWTKDRRVAEVLYRSTEVIRKHSADLWFIPRVFERIGFEPNEVRFYYANAYLSGVFFSMLFRWWDPIRFLETLRREDVKLFVGGCRFLRRSVASEKTKFPYSPENHQHLHLWKHHRQQIKSIREYLQEYMPP